ncbi:hypothetical protein EYF80_008148 [Liparis tanakae]|uniref:Uncharacterized protein n=1 Tax=Liparis tanakae TaxID=230148 RepID=A0A4Z2IWP2_9TELE|nr:hypothetical protein EYF80_008148 [Liparis tanakae]
MAGYWLLNQGIGSQYLGGELDWLGEGELGWRRRDRGTLGCLFLCALSLSQGLRLPLLPCLSRLLLLLLGLLICRCGCLSLLIGLGGCVGSVSSVGCAGLLHGRSQELRLSLLQQHLLLGRQQSCQLAKRERIGEEKRGEERRREGKRREERTWTEGDGDGNKVFKKQHKRSKQGKSKANHRSSSHPSGRRGSVTVAPASPPHCGLRTALRHGEPRRASLHDVA